MYCPNCKYEYKDGVDECPECGEKLIDSIPPEDIPDYYDMVTVYSTSDQAKILIAKSLLEDADIRFYASGDGIMDLFGAGRLGFNPVVGAVEFKVLAGDEEEAKEILTGLIEDDLDDDPDDEYDDDEEEEY
ncbi:MAG: DUF2007 domain-containing protein [Candidatus Zixiibacteriota bacterium]